MPAFHCPVRLVWGPGSLAGLADILRACGISRPLLVSDRRILDGPAGQAVRAALGPDVATFDGCGVDGRAADAEACGVRMNRDGLDGVVGLGGGSALCTAKGAAMAATCGSLRALEGRGDLPADPMPMVLIPTTAGSGTEVSPFTILKDEADGAKFTIGGPRGFARVAVLDPVSLEGLPVPVARPAAIDALSHALEALTSLKATPLSDALALRAARLLFPALPGAIIGGQEQARADNLLGSALANMACGQARLGLAHRLARPLEAATGATHGQAIGALLPGTLEPALARRPEIVPDLTAAIGIAQGGPKAVVDELRDLYARIGFDPALPEAAMSADEIARAALHRPGEPALPGNPDDASQVPSANGQSLPLEQARAIVARALA